MWPDILTLFQILVCQDRRVGKLCNTYLDSLPWIVSKKTNVSKGQESDVIMQCAKWFFSNMKFLQTRVSSHLRSVARSMLVSANVAVSPSISASVTSIGITARCALLRVKATLSRMRLAALAPCLLVHTHGKVAAELRLRDVKRWEIQWDVMPRGC